MIALHSSSYPALASTRAFSAGRSPSFGHGGVRGFAPRLPLDDPDAGPSGHADTVVEAVSQVRDPLVSIGQSLGAFAASLVAVGIEVAELVLGAPMLPAPGRNRGQLVGRRQARQSDRSGGPMSTWGSGELTEVLLHDVPAVAERFGGIEMREADPYAVGFRRPAA